MIGLNGKQVLCSFFRPRGFLAALVTIVRDIISPGADGSSKERSLLWTVHPASWALFGNQFTLVEVVTDSVSDAPIRQLWVAAAKPDQAVTLVLCAVPVGWTASLADGHLTPNEEAALNLKPGEVRELR